MGKVVKLCKSGKSLVITLPKAIYDIFHLQEGSKVEIEPFTTNSVQPQCQEMTIASKGWDYNIYPIYALCRISHDGTPLLRTEYLVVQPLDFLYSFSSFTNLISHE